MSFTHKSNIKVNKNVQCKNSNGTEEEVLKGSVADINNKTSIPVRTVGVNIGVTMNMGNYQSLRIDVWSADKIRDKETRKEAIFRIANDLANALHELQDKYGGEENNVESTRTRN